MPTGMSPASAHNYCTNLVNFPAELLGSVAFNDEPIRLRIHGVKEMFPGLFEMLDQAETLVESAEAFHSYMSAIFGLDTEQRVKSDEPRRFRSDYLRLLRGWGCDSNSREGAVLKGWVESRFGLLPSFHHKALGRYGSPEWMAYVEEKMSSRFHNNSIQVQLDLLYEFCQWALARFAAPGQRHMTLHRGVHDFSEHAIIERIDRRTAVINLNNLNSFTADRDIAGEFGDIILTAEVPVVKILFFPQLVSRHGLKGEAEYLVIGGDYRLICRYD